MGLRLALKIDVCTRHGLERGVEPLLDLLRALRLRASFFVTMGPDRSGLAALRLLRPGFLRKLLATRALSLYGLRTALSGTFLPARPVGAARPDLLRRIRDEGHELALHGWDHRAWQDRVERFTPTRLRGELDRAFAAFEAAAGSAARAFGAPGWTASPAALLDLDSRGLEYTSSSRGGEPFFPVIAGRGFEGKALQGPGLEGSAPQGSGPRPLRTLEVPTTLPCPEEVLAASPRDDPYRDSAYRLRPEGLEVLGVHAEFDGSSLHREALGAWLRRRLAEGAEVVTLAEAARLATAEGEPPRRPLRLASLPGRPSLVLTGFPAALSAP